MAMSAVVKSVDITRRRKRVVLAVTPSGNYPTGGDTLDLSAVTNPNAIPGGFFSGYVPQKEDVSFNDSLGGTDADWTPGTTFKNGLVKLWAANNTEHANGAYTASELGDTLIVEVSVPMGK